MAGILPGGLDLPAHRRSRLDYGQELRDQIEADRNRRLLARQQSANAIANLNVNVPPRQAFDQISANNNNMRLQQQQQYARPRLPAVPGAQGAPSPGERGRVRRPHSSGSEIGSGRGKEGKRGAAWEAEAYKLSEQVQEMMISVHTRLAGVEKAVRGDEKSVGEMRERLQLVEMDHAAMRAEQKTLCSSERMLQLERDTAQKLHRHLEHVTSVEAEQLSAAMQRVHEMQVKAEDDRRKLEKLQEETRQQQEVIKIMTERLMTVEDRGKGLEKREVEGFQAMSEHRARLEFRVQELESAIVSVSNRGEQVAMDTGNAVRTFVDAKNSEIVDQLQKAVSKLSLQVSSVQEEVLQRGKDLVEMVQLEGKGRVQDMSVVSEKTEDQIGRMQRLLEEERARNSSTMNDSRRAVEEIRAHVEDLLQRSDANVREAVSKVAGDQRGLRAELRELSERAMAAAEESRRFLEEVVRAEIRGRMQGQQQLNEQIVAISEDMEKNRGGKKEGEGEGEFNDEVYSQLRLINAKQKAAAKALKVVSSEVDVLKSSIAAFQEESKDELRSHAMALKQIEDRMSMELNMGVQATKDIVQVLETRVSGLENGRHGILEKIYTNVDANRAKDLERAKETMERIEALQRAVDACVEMCQSDLQEVHEGLESVENRLDKEAEGLEAIIESTTRQLTSTLDEKLNESMALAVENLAGSIKRDIEFVKEDLTRVSEQTRDVDARVESVRRHAENKTREAERECERVEQKAAADAQMIRDDVWSLRSAYVARMDVIDERVNEAKGDAARHTAEAVHRDQQLDAKIRYLEQRLLHAGGLTLPTSALGAAHEVDRSLLSGSSDALLGGGAVVEGADAASRRGLEGGMIGALQAEVSSIKERMNKDKNALDRLIAQIFSDAGDEKKRAAQQVAMLMERIDGVYNEASAQWLAIVKRQDADAQLLEEEMAEMRSKVGWLRVEAERLVADSRQQNEAKLAEFQDTIAGIVSAQKDGDQGMLGKMSELEAKITKTHEEIEAAQKEAKEAVLELSGQVEEARGTQGQKDSSLEERFRNMVVEMSKTMADQHQRLVQTVLSITTRADDLATTAIELKDAQKVYMQKVQESKAQVSKSMREQGKLVCDIADAHRRDLDKVCRDATCVHVLDGIISQIEYQVLAERVSVYQEKITKSVHARVNTLSADVRDNVIPSVVRQDVDAAITLQLLPVKYDVKSLKDTIEMNHGEGEKKAQHVESVLDSIKVENEAARQRLSNLETSSDLLAGDVMQLASDLRKENATVTKRVHGVQAAYAADAIAGTVEDMLLKLEVAGVHARASEGARERDREAKRQMEQVAAAAAAAQQKGSLGAEQVSVLTDRLNSLDDSMRGEKERVGAVEQALKTEKARVDGMEDLLNTVAEQVSEQGDEEGTLEQMSIVMKKIEALEQRVEVVELQSQVAQESVPELATVAEEEDEAVSSTRRESIESPLVESDAERREQTPHNAGAESSESTDAMWAGAANEGLEVGLDGAAGAVSDGAAVGGGDGAATVESESTPTRSAAAGALSDGAAAGGDEDGAATAASGNTPTPPAAAAEQPDQAAGDGEAQSGEQPDK